MKEDLVNRLFDSDEASALTNEAAREIERLRSALERIAVEQRYSGGETAPRMNAYGMNLLAKETLRGEKP